MTALYVVTLYPYEDGSEARYQFDDLDMAEAFAAKVAALPEETLRYVTGTGKPIAPSVWVSGTYESVEAAWEALGDYADVEDDDGKTLIAGVLYDNETGEEADPQ